MDQIGGNKRKRSQKIRDLVEQHFAKQEQQRKKKSSLALKREELKAKISKVQIPPKNVKNHSPSKLEKADSKHGSQKHNSNEKVSKHVSNLIIASMSSNITPTFHPSILNSNSPIPIGSLTTSGFIDTNSLKQRHTQTIMNTLSKKGDENQSLNNFDEHH